MNYPGPWNSSRYSECVQPRSLGHIAASAPPRIPRKFYTGATRDILATGVARGEPSGASLYVGDQANPEESLSHRAINARTFLC